MSHESARPPFGRGASWSKFQWEHFVELNSHQPAHDDLEGTECSVDTSVFHLSLPSVVTDGDLFCADLHFKTESGDSDSVKSIDHEFDAQFRSPQGRYPQYQYGANFEYAHSNTDDSPEAKARKYDITHKDAPEHARKGQHTWRSEKLQAEEEWKELRIGEFNPNFKRQIALAKKTFKSQKIALLYKMQIAAVQRIIAPLLDERSDAWRGFWVLQPDAFKTYFDNDLTYKSFCNMWRRAGFSPERKKWEEAFNGLVAFQHE